MTYREEPRKWKLAAFLTALTLVFLLAIFTVVISMYYAGIVIRPPRKTVEPININIAYPYSSVSFRSRDDMVQLYGWHFSPNKTENALIIAHEFGGNRFPFGMDTIELIDAMAAAGYNALTFDMRNSGNTEEGISAFGLREKYDVLGAVDYMRKAGYTNVAVLGVSTGANAAAAAGAESEKSEIGALILDSPIVDMRKFIMRLVREKNPDLPDFPFDFEIQAFAGFYAAANISDANAAHSLDMYMPRPVQLIYGNNDEIVSHDEITGLYDDYMNRAVGKISIWSVPGAGHGECFYTARDEYLERVMTFLRRVFQ